MQVDALPPAFHPTNDVPIQNTLNVEYKSNPSCFQSLTNFLIGLSIAYSPFEREVIALENIRL